MTNTQQQIPNLTLIINQTGSEIITTGHKSFTFLKGGLDLVSFFAHTTLECNAILIERKKERETESKTERERK